MPVLSLQFYCLLQVSLNKDIQSFHLQSLLATLHPKKIQADMVFGETSFKTMQTNFKSVVFFLLRKKIRTFGTSAFSSRFFSSNKYFSLGLANQIAQIFKDHFQIMYAYDGKKTNHPHIHFAVNAYSYYPTVPALTKARFTSYLEKVKLLLRNEYPNTEVQILFKEDSQNV